MKWIWLLALLFILPSAHAQSGFFMPANQKRVEIPFDYVNDFILVKLHFKGAFELRFIFDTGAEHTILSKREIADIWNLPFERSFPITGSDLSTPIIAHLVRRIKLDIPEKATAPGEDILVLQEDYFRFEEYAGVNVHGILAAGAFSRYIIEIDYIRKKIILHDRDFYKIKESEYIAIPLEIYRNKPSITTKLHIQQDSVIDVKLLLDTGAGLPLMLFSNLHPLIHPPPKAIPANIGMGLGGFLEGYTGRIQDLELGTYKQGGVLTYFQELDTIGKSAF
ncbi:MAG: hypothetical protein IT269_00280, partial [Saprospiraceae bacterium]|nr:hypothetical protein [Saprospiraceae bacterium]